MTTPAQPTVVVVGQPKEGETPPQDAGAKDREIDQATRFGELLESYRQLQEKIFSLESRLESMASTQAEVSALRSELASLRAQEAKIEEKIEETKVEGDVVLVAPVPESTPKEEEEPPAQPKKSWIETILST